MTSYNFTGSVTDTKTNTTVTKVAPFVVNTATPAPFYGVNYLGPSAYAGASFWNNYSTTKSMLRTDIQKIAGLGLNGVRAFLEISAFAFPTSPTSGGPSAAMLANLQDAYSAYVAAGFRVHWTFFGIGMGDDFGQIGAATRWVNMVISALQAVEPSLAHTFCFEIRNEIFDGTDVNLAYGGTFDSGWPSSVPHTTMEFPTRLVFVQYMTYAIRAAAPGVPVTTSVPSAQNRPVTYPANGCGLSYYYSNSFGTDWQPDWYDYHLYGDIVTNLGYTTQVLNGAPFRCGEFASDVEGTTITAAQRAAQATYAQDGRYYCAQQANCITEPQWWWFYDSANGTQPPAGQSDGLYDGSGSITPAGQVYVTYPPGTVPPKV